MAVGFCAGIVGLLILSQVFGGGGGSTSGSVDAGAVSMRNDVQVITIAAKGGYSPQYIEAKSGVATELQVVTNGTYDCSSSIVIPSLGYRKNLKPTGTETISISALQAQGKIDGTCGMGMYSFEISFK